jgi:type IV secretion system protein VirB11
MISMATPSAIQTEQHQRLDSKLRRELGELVLSHLADDSTEDIVLNPDSSLWVKRIGEGFVRIGEMPPAQAASALNKVAAWKGTVLNHEHPILETELPLDGSRFEGIVSPVVRQPVFAIRLRPKRVFRLEEYEAQGILSRRTEPLNRARREEDFGAVVRETNHACVIREAIAAKKK